MNIKVSLFILIQILCSLSFAQKRTPDPLAKKISERLLFHRLYSAWEGKSYTWENGNEIAGEDDLRRNIIFKDSLFEEFVFKDDYEGIPRNKYKIADSCTIKEYRIKLYRGTWTVKKDTVRLTCKFSRIYRGNSVEFSTCYYNYDLDPEDKAFTCTTVPFCDSECFKTRIFLYKNGYLKEIGNLEYTYK